MSTTERRSEAPPHSSARISRDELLHLLDRSRDFALTLLLAPAGFGKSTLLQHWQQQHQGLCTLLCLDAGDADPVRFFRRLSETLRHVVPGFDTVSYNPLSAEIALPATHVVEALEQAFAAVPGPLTVVLDDFQHANAFIQDVMARLLERLPPQVHFIIASRVHPDFSLSRLKLADRLLLIDAHDLRLDAVQIRELSLQLRLQLDDREINQLLAITEGWMVGVKIALLAEARTGGQALAAFNGRQPEIVDYFAHVVLRDLTPAMHDFVLCTAAFQEFDAGLCDTVLKRRDSARLIESIVAQALFLQEIEDKPGWYRYHPLFRDFLENRLHVEIPERIEGLHAAACDYLLAQGETEMALDHAEQSTEEKFRATLCECCATWLHKGDYPAIIRWVEPLPDEDVLAQGDMIFPLIGALIFTRRFNQARYYLDALQEQEGTAAGRFTDDSTPTFLEVMLQLFQHETDFLLQADHAVLLASCRHHDIRAFSLAILAYHYLLHADFAQSRQYGLQAKTVLGQLGYDYLESYADLILILCDRNTGHVLPAIQRAEALLERFRHKPHTPAWINAMLAIAVVRYEQNRLEEAQSICEELMPLVNTACATEVIVITYLTLCRLLALHGEHTRSGRLIHQLQRILQLGNYERFLGQVAFEELLQAIAMQNNEAVERVARQHQLQEKLAKRHWQGQRHYEEGWERYGLATALFLRSKNRLAEAENVLVTLSQATRHFEVRARALIIDANLVVIHHLQGNHGDALELLQHLIRDHGLLGINRIVFDEAPGLAEVMQQAFIRQQLALPDLYLDFFKDVFAPRQPVAALPATAPMPVALTAKEVEILELLQQGLSNNEISQATGVALSTTKWHLKNIFAKLGVANRTAAILRAGQRGNLLQ